MTTFYIGFHVASELDFFSSSGEQDGSFFETHNITVRRTKTYVALVVPDEALRALEAEVVNAEDILADQAGDGDIATIGIHRGMVTLLRKVHAARAEG